MREKTKEIKKTGRPKRVKTDDDQLDINESSTYGDPTLMFRYEGARIYRFHVWYDRNGSNVLIYNVKTIVGVNDYPVERTIGNIGKHKFKSLIDKMVRKKEGLSPLGPISWTDELQSFLGS